MKHALSFACCLSLAGLLPSAGIAVEEQLLNGSFEDGLTHWNQSVEGTAAADETLTIDETFASEGKSSLFVERTTTPVWLTKEVKVKPNTGYRLKFSYFTEKLTGDTLMLFFYLRDEERRSLGDYGTQTLPGTANVWVEVELEFTTPSDAFLAGIDFYFKPGVKCWIDNVELIADDSIMPLDFSVLYPDNKPLYEEVMIPDSAPEKPLAYPYWTYSMQKALYASTAKMLGIPYSIESEIEESAKHNLAPFQHGLHKPYPELTLKHKTPALFYPVSICYSLALEQGAVEATNGMANYNDPIYSEVVKKTIRETPMEGVDPDQPLFVFLADEWYRILTYIPTEEKRTDDYWKTLDPIVKERFGFGKYGLPASDDDPDPFKKIAYLRCQADQSIATLLDWRREILRANPKAIIVGTDEWSSATPLDWERMAQASDIQPGQTLHYRRGVFRFTSSYLTKFYHDLTGKPVYPYLQFIKYPSPPKIEALYEWMDQIFQAGGSGVFAGAVEWFDRELNHPKISDPEKWEAFLSICDRAQRMNKLKLPEDPKIAIHYGSYTAMANGRNASSKPFAWYSLLGPRSRSYPTITDDFRIDRDNSRWDKFSLVVLPDQKFLSEETIHAIERFLSRGGTLLVPDRDAFQFRIDGEDLTNWREKLLGVKTVELLPKPETIVLADGTSLFNPGSYAFALELLDPDNTTILATYPNGQPAMIEHSVGEGKVIFCGFEAATDFSVDSVEWVKYWRNFLAERDIPLDDPIWRFTFPREEPSEKIWHNYLAATGNGYQMIRNQQESWMNLPNADGSYRYDVAPQMIPDAVGEDGTVPFSTGKLTNRGNWKQLAVDGSGYFTDPNAKAEENWVVRFGQEETSANAITIDLGKSFDLAGMRFYFNGNFPGATVSTSNDGKSFTEQGSLASGTGDTYTVLERTLDLSGTGRFVRIAWPERNGGTLTLIETDIWVKKP